MSMKKLFKLIADHGVTMNIRSEDAGKCLHIEFKKGKYCYHFTMDLDKMFSNRYVGIEYILIGEFDQFLYNYNVLMSNHKGDEDKKLVVCNREFWKPMHLLDLIVDLKNSGVDAHHIDVDLSSFITPHVEVRILYPRQTMGIRWDEGFGFSRIITHNNRKDRNSQLFDGTLYECIMLQEN